jgi:hypothetical protein
MAEHDAPYRRAKHHFLQHELPRLSQKAVLALIGATSTTEALDLFNSKKPAYLRVGFASGLAIQLCHGMVLA